MRNKSILKIANIVSIFVVFALLVMPLVGFAQLRIPGQDVGQSTNPAQGFASGGTITDFIITIIQILLAIVGLIAVIFLVIGGFRYIVSAGNDEQAQAAKKTIINAIIGIVVVILAFVIVRVIANAVAKQNV